MLSTKDIQSTQKNKSKIFRPGNITAKITSIFLQPQKSNPEAYFLMMNLEGEDLGPEFEGFFYDSAKPELGRAKGQVARVKFSQYSYKDMVSKAGYAISRDRQILRDIVVLAEQLGVRKQIDSIEAESIEEFVKSASKFFNNGEFLFWCIGGSAYMKDDGNKDYTLYLPKYNKAVTTKNFASIPNKDQVTVFNYDMHVQDDTKKDEEIVSGWGSTPETPTQEAKPSTWTPSGFEL